MTSELAAGLALAATVHADREGAAVMAALAPELASELRAKLDALRAASGDGARERALGELAARLRPEVPEVAGENAALPGRALALLATEVSRPVGARWIAASPAPRRGFRVGAPLRAALRRLAADAADPALEGSERGRGRALVWALTRGESEPPRDALLGALGAQEAAAVAALGALIDAGGDPARVEDEALARALMRAAFALAPGHEATRALGAMERGAEEGGRGAWRRAGAEAAQVWRSACRG